MHSASTRSFTKTHTAVQPRAVPLVFTYIETGLVPRFPTAILVTGMTIVAVLSFFAGLILDTVTRGRREMRRLAYLAQPAPGNQL